MRSGDMSVDMIHGNRYRLYVAGACKPALLFCLLYTLVSAPAHPQSPSQLDRLVFEPVLIDDAGEEITSITVPLQFLPMDEDGEEDGEVGHVESGNTPAPLEIVANIDAYRESVRNLEAEQGPFTPELYEVLVDLGNQYQLAGEHETAIEIFQRAEHISRVNNGLYDPQQFSSIEKMIDSYMAMGDVASANEKQRYLVYLSEQHYGQADPNILPSVIDLADHNMANFNRVMAREEMPVLSFSSGTGFGPSRRDPTPKEMAFGSLFMAQQNYLQAISTMIDNRQYFDPMLLDLEYSFLETLLLQAFRPAILEDADYYLSDRGVVTGSLLRKDYASRYASYNYATGKAAFERILIYVRNNPQSRVYQLVNALMEYGDWNMLFGKTMSAMEKYSEAYALVQELGVQPDVVEELFRPGIPVHLPLVTAKPNSREKFGIPDDAELEYAGYVDIAFTVSKYGRAKRFDILATSGEATREVERRLIRYLRNSPFRPRLEADEDFSAHRVTVRYYFTYADQVS